MASIEWLRHHCHVTTNPLAPPDRRYQLARATLGGGYRLFYAHDDRATWRLFQYLRQRARAAGDSRAEALLRKAHPDFTLAFRIRRGNLRSLRSEMEAYILSAGMDAAIAARLGVSAEVVRCYRQSFYDVGHLRHVPLYITQHLIGVVDEDGRSTLDAHRLWKLVGYCLGPGELDRLFFTGERNQSSEKAESLEAWCARHSRALLARQQLVAAHYCDARNRKQTELLLKMLDGANRREDATEAAPENLIEQHIKAMLGELPWCHGSVAKEAFQDTDLGRYDGMAAELRDDELQLVAAGEKVPTLEGIAAMSIGPPRQQTPASQPREDQRT